MRRPHLKGRVKWALWSILGGFLKGAPMPIYTDGTFQKGASLSVVGFEVLKIENRCF